MYKAFEVDTETGEISIAALTPQKDISASHIILKSGFASVNFATGESEMVVSAPLRIAAATAAQAVSLKPATVPTLEGTHFVLLSIDFIQEVNNADYSLNNNAYNVLAIVSVD